MARSTRARERIDRKVWGKKMNCPNCNSGNIEVVENTDISWGNNDQGICLETVECLDCRCLFYTEARIEVVSRKLQEID